MSSTKGLHRRSHTANWWASYTDENGQRVRRSTGTQDEREAKLILARWKKEADAVRLHGQEPLRPLDDLLLAYLKGPSARKRSHETDLHRAKSLRRVLGNPDLRTFSARHIAAYRVARLSEGVSDTTTNRELALLSKAINWACMDLDWKIPNPVKGRLVREPEGRIRWITPEEAERLIAAASQARRLHGLDDFIILGLHTGMRRDEMLGLEWARVDQVNRAIQLEESHTKAKRRRRVPLSQRAWEALRRRDAFRSQSCPDSPWVFCHADGTRWADIRGGFAKACADAGIENFHIHDLRHTCASWLVMAGAPLYEVRDLLGHSTVVMTERYAHLAPETLRSTVSRLDSLGDCDERSVTVEEKRSFRGSRR